MTLLNKNNAPTMHHAQEQPKLHVGQYYYSNKMSFLHHTQDIEANVKYNGSIQHHIFHASIPINKKHGKKAFMSYHYSLMPCFLSTHHPEYYSALLFQHVVYKDHPCLEIHQSWVPQKHTHETKIEENNYSITINVYYLALLLCHFRIYFIIQIFT